VKQTRRSSRNESQERADSGSGSSFHSLGRESTDETPRLRPVGLDALKAEDEDTGEDNVADGVANQPEDDPVGWEGGFPEGKASAQVAKSRQRGSFPWAERKEGGQRLYFNAYNMRDLRFYLNAT
jgi:hypothetical protein